MLANVGVFKIIFRKKKTTTGTYCNWLVEFSIKLPAIYVNIKKYIENKIKNTIENVFKGALLRHDVECIEA